MLGHLHEGRAGAPQHYARGQFRPRTRPAAEYAPHDDASRTLEFSKRLFRQIRVVTLRNPPTVSAVDDPEARARDKQGH